MCSTKFVRFIVMFVFVDVIVVTLGKPTDGDFDSKSSLNSYRFDHDQIYESMPQCTSRKHVINPDDLIKSSGGEYVFDQNFSQKIEVELCENEGSSCSEDLKMKTRCRQRYLTIQLQVISKNSTHSEPKSFQIPSNCECSYLKLQI